MSENDVLKMRGCLNAGLKLRSGILSTVWESPLTLVWKHAIAILILHEFDGSPALIHRRPVIEVEHLMMVQVKEDINALTPSSPLIDRSRGVILRSIDPS